MTILLYIYLSIGLIWFLIITAYLLPEFHPLKFVWGCLAYPILFPIFFYLNVRKYHTCKQYMKPFSKYRILFFNDYVEKSNLD